MIKVIKGNKLLYEIMISTRLFSLNNNILSLAEGTLFWTTNRSTNKELKALSESFKVCSRFTNYLVRQKKKSAANELITCFQRQKRLRRNVPSSLENISEFRT